MKAGRAVERAASPRISGPKSDGLNAATPRPATTGPQAVPAPTNGNPIREVPAVASTHFLRSRIGKICVAIIGTTPAEMIEKATVVREDPFLEFRLDYLDKPLVALPKLKQFLAEHGAATAIATCRRAANGGKFAGTVTAEVEILSKAAARRLPPRRPRA